MDTLILIFKLSVICYVLSELANSLATLLLGVDFKSKYAKIASLVVMYVFSCTLCFTFWASLLGSGSLFVAATTALIVSNIKYYLNEPI